MFRENGKHPLFMTSGKYVQPSLEPKVDVLATVCGPHPHSLKCKIFMYMSLEVVLREETLSDLSSSPEP